MYFRPEVVDEQLQARILALQERDAASAVGESFSSLCRDLQASVHAIST